MSYVPVELRRQITELAGGCCEYCRVHQSDSTSPYHVEHIIAVSHGGQTVIANLALSCARCNLTKGTNIAAADPDSGEPTFLFHPRRHQWQDHFDLDEALIVPRTPEARATVFVLRLNDPERVEYHHLLLALGVYPC